MPCRSCAATKPATNTNGSPSRADIKKPSVRLVHKGVSNKTYRGNPQMSVPERAIHSRAVVKAARHTPQQTWQDLLRPGTRNAETIYSLSGTSVGRVGRLPGEGLLAAFLFLERAAAAVLRPRMRRSAPIPAVLRSGALLGGVVRLSVAFLHARAPCWLSILACARACVLHWLFQFTPERSVHSARRSTLHRCCFMQL